MSRSLDVIDGLSADQMAAVEMLISGLKQKDVAAKLGVSVRALREWQHKPEFRSALRAYRREITDRNATELSRLSIEAIEGLYDLSIDKDAPHNVRLGAFKALLDSKIKAVELADVIDVIDELQAKIDGMGVTK